MVSVALSPKSTRSGPTVSTTSCGRVAVVRAEASAPNWTVATLPISPSTMGINCISTVNCWPGRIVPSVHTTSPRAPRLAWGLVPSNRAPLGTMSRTSTEPATVWPTLRTVI